MSVIHPGAEGNPLLARNCASPWAMGFMSGEWEGDCPTLGGGTVGQKTKQNNSLKGHDWWTLGAALTNIGLNSLLLLCEYLCYSHDVHIFFSHIKSSLYLMKQTKILSGIEKKLVIKNKTKQKTNSKST